MSDSNKFIVQISDIDWNMLTSNPKVLLEHLKEEDKSLLQEYILDRLHTRDGGPSITNFHIDRFRVDEETKKGSFRLLFDIERQFCCSGSESCTNDYLDFDFHRQGEGIIAFTEYMEWTLNN